MLPSRSCKSIFMLALILGGIKGPITVPGLITTTSNPFSLENSQAAFSARVFETEYHSYKKKKIKKIRTSGCLFKSQLLSSHYKINQAHGLCLTNRIQEIPIECHENTSFMIGRKVYIHFQSFPHNP